jgi:arogenate dehydrogenase (NADP+)
MAGTAETGMAAAQFQLFCGNPYAITPIATTLTAATATVTDLALTLGADVFSCQPEEHDQAVALISHLPVFVSASLIATAAAEQNVIGLAQRLASSGFRDTSRVGGGNPELGRMMAEFNHDALLSALSKYQKQLGAMITAIEAQDWDGLTTQLEQTQQLRPPFLKPES